MSNKYEETIDVCPECGSEDVMEALWVYTNRLDKQPRYLYRVAGVEFDSCDNCKARIEIISKEEYEKREERND